MRIRVSAEADVTRAAMMAARFAEHAGFDGTDRAMLSTAVSELARNIIRYAGRGEVTLRSLPGPGVEVVAADDGPGIPDPERALEDHYSTGGTLGLGLPGVRRMMDDFDLVTSPGSGTRVTVRKWGRDAVRPRAAPAPVPPRPAPAPPRPAPVPPRLAPVPPRLAPPGRDAARSVDAGPPAAPPEDGRVDSAVVVRPRAGARAGGDTAVVRRDGARLMAAIVDVLGHGAAAREVAAMAEQFLGRSPLAGPAELMSGLDEHIRGTRGAAAGIAVLEVGTGWLRYVGIGNTSFRRIGDRESKTGEDRLQSRPGIVGGRSRAPREERLLLSRGDVVLMYTDGVRDHFTVDEYPRILGHGAAVIARTVVRRFGKQHDDAGCVALRFEP